MKIIISLLLLTLPHHDATAADVVGNGGDAIICKNGSAELLDLYEARTLRGIQFDPTLEAANPEQIAHLAINRLERLDPRRAGAYRAKITRFRQEARFVPDANLVDIPDSREIALPRDCELKQVAIQRTPEFPEDNRYLIDQTIWAALPVRDQAALILHEVVYGEALERGHLDSVRTRYFNSNLFSQKLPGLIDEEYSSLLRFSGLLNFLSRYANLLFARHPYGIDAVDINLGQKLCKREGRELAEFYNDSYFGSLYPALGIQVRNELGESGSLNAAYVGSNGFGHMGIVVTEFNTTRSIFRGPNHSEYVICK